jgi:hypothetical protein
MLLYVAVAQLAATSTVTYEVSTDARLERLDVHMCLDRPAAIEPCHDDVGRTYLLGEVEPHGERCFRYRVSLSRAAEADREVARRVGRDVMFDPDVWLWCPASDVGVATVRFKLPEGVAVSVPWKETAGVHQISPSTFRWRGLMALGHFQRRTLEVPGGVLEIARLDGAVRASPAGIDKWLREAARAVSTLYGALPADRVQVIIDPVRGDGVEFGLALRGGGPTLMLLLGRDADDGALLGEWVAVHELSHFALPFTRKTDRWLAATYYQYVLRARAGLISEREAWQEILEGFDRGRNQKTGQTLAEDSERMLEEHNFMRVYWSGTAIALLADVELRKSGHKSLDSAIFALRGCCLSELRIWTAAEVIAALDRVGAGIFQKLHDQWVPARALPDVHGILRELGVRMEKGRIVLDDAAPLANVRKAITQKRD